MGAGERASEASWGPPRGWWVRGALLSLVTSLVVAGLALVTISVTETDRRRPPPPPPWYLQMLERAIAPSCRFRPGHPAPEATAAERAAVAAFTQELSGERSCAVTPTYPIGEGAYQWTVVRARLRAHVASSAGSVRVNPATLHALSQVAGSGLLVDAAEIAGIPVPSDGPLLRTGVVALSRGGLLVRQPAGGPISWMPAVVYAWWSEQGGASSPLGVPISNPRVEASTIVQEFERGRVRSGGETIEAWVSGRAVIEIEIHPLRPDMESR